MAPPAPAMAPAAPLTLLLAASEPLMSIATPITSPVVLVNSLEKLNEARTYLSVRRVVAIDCEGNLDLDERFYLRLIQVGALNDEQTSDAAAVGRVFVFDMQYGRSLLSNYHNFKRLFKKASNCCMAAL